MSVGEGRTDIQGEGDSRPKVVRHLRALDPVLLSAVAVAVGILSYFSTVGSREDATRKAELKDVEIRAREYTDSRVNLVGGSLETLREYSRDTNKRQDDQIEYLRKLMIQVAK